MLAFISSTFLDHLRSQADISAANGVALLFDGQPKWDQGGIASGWSGDILDVPGFNSSFNRDDLNDIHTKALVTAGQTNGGRISDSRAVKFQSDYLAGEERMTRLRHATGIRCAYHMTARNIAHGHGNGVYYGGILVYVQDVMASGYNGSDTGVGP